jgi:hypothetical protein
VKQPVYIPLKLNCHTIKIRQKISKGEDFMENLIQLGAYVLVILIIGGASVIKKIIEAKNRRKELEKNKVNTLRVDEYSQDQPQPAHVETVVLEKEISSKKEEEIPVRLEDVIRKMFNIPDVKPKYDNAEEIEVQVQPQEAMIDKNYVPQAVDDKIASQEIDNKEHVQESENWDNFTQSLNARGLNEIQRAIIISDLIRYPVSRRNRVNRLSGLNR